MDRTDDLAELLASRRANVTPEQAGLHVMELPADGGLTMSIYTAEPDSRSEEALNLLASWSATAAAPRS